MKNNRGVVLIITLIIILVLTILAGAFFTRSITERSIASNYYNSTQALWLAESGIQKSIWELNHNSCGNCTACGTSRCISGSLAGGNYNATIDTSARTVISTGTFKGFTRTVFANLAFKSVFQYGLFCHDHISFTNSASIDSYYSSKGAYNALLSDGENNVGADGDVGTDSTDDAAITLINNSKINGDAGVGGDPSTGIVLENSADITGSTTGDVNLPMPGVPVPSAPSGGWLTITAKDLNTGGYLAPSLALDSKNRELNINGDVTLYVTGNITLNNMSNVNVNPGGKLTLYVDGTFSVDQTSKLNNTTQIPGNLTIYSRYNGGDVGINFNQNTAMYGTIYAPQTNVTLAQSFQLFGALVAGSASLFNSTQIHYDLDLANNPTPFATPSYTTNAWHEAADSSGRSPF